MNVRYRDTLFSVTYIVVLAAIGGFVLFMFLHPTPSHVGISQYERAKYLDMVEWNAHKPFVYRTLLPTSVRIVTSIVPEPCRQACVVFVEQHKLTRRAFAVFRWETQAAFQYVLGSVLMFLSFVGFAHYFVRLITTVCSPAIPRGACSLLGSAALLGLVPFFQYASYAYDPPQLFLFTLALYFIADRRYTAFFIAFIFCCLNKETAVLLIPVYGLWVRHDVAHRHDRWSMLGGLIAVYLGIKLTLTWLFADNTGNLVEFQLLHNVSWLIRGWTFTDMAVFLSFSILVFFHWREKPEFLRLSFMCVLPPLLGLGVFLGYLDEWRVYYEAYPIALGLIVDSFLRIRRAFPDQGTLHPGNPADG